jgi:cytochrome d ubiquinol oxidase subunit I
LSRIQFAFTIGFHYIFPPLTIGLAWFIFGVISRYKSTGNELYRDIARFWVRMLAATFVVGAATGIAMEFQFGTNWADYSRFVGDIFGAPLAIEAVVAFFLESTFLAILVFAWDRVSMKVVWFASLMVALGTTLSAFWILVANSWQQTPAGFEIIDGRARLVDFTAAVFNASTWPRFLHTTSSALATAAFFIIAISAAYLLRGKHIEFARKSLSWAIVAGLIFSIGQLVTGHASGAQVAATQPAKLAAMEGVYETTRGAAMVVIGVPSPGSDETISWLKIPKLLSFLSFGDFNAEVKGLNDFPKRDHPPVLVTFATFRTMVGAGLAMIGLTALGALLLWRNMLHTQKLFLRLLVLAMPLPFIANELGWVTAEMGRQPWVVYNVMRTSEAVSTSVPSHYVLASSIIFIMIYALLFAAWVDVLRRIYLKGPSGSVEVAE